ncbi:uncharacterized protein LOC141901102 [Tubulanus polymorphus]|uniref:uncharacterized protein LOC141901102 n=1 Tax=Tubulanus polymorphus TaxID=672921 RepID=UPI003DA5FE49
MNFVILVRRRKDNRTTFQYLSLLAVTDACFLLLQGFLDQFLNNRRKAAHHAVSYFGVAVDIYTLSKFTCKLYFVGSSCFMMSSWIVTAFSMERAIIVWYPLKAHVIFTQTRRSLVLFACIIIPLFIYSPESYWMTQAANGDCVTISVKPCHRFVYTVMSQCLKGVLPCVIIACSNIAIVLGILTAPKIENTKSNRKNDRILRNMFLVSTMFFVLVMPYTVIWLYYDVYNMECVVSATETVKHRITNIGRFYGPIASTFCNLNFCLNFVIYASTLDFYRAELKRMICCQRC